MIMSSILCSLFILLCFPVTYVKSYAGTTISSILSSDLVQSHKLSFESLNEISAYSSNVADGNIQQPYFLCGSLSELKETRSYLQNAFQVSEKFLCTAFVQKSSNTGCLFVDPSVNVMSTNNLDIMATWTPILLPQILKLDTSVLSFFNEESNEQQSSSEEAFNSEKSIELETDISNSPEYAKLIIEFTPGAIVTTDIRTLADEFLSISTAYNLVDDTQLLTSPAWDEIIAKMKEEITFNNNFEDTTTDSNRTKKRRFRKLQGQQDCTIPTSSTINYNMRSFEILNLSDFDGECILKIVQNAASSSKVLRVLIGYLPQTQNYEARGLTQTNSMGNEPYTLAGLTGKNQVVGVADTGLNDLSCFFIDNSNKYSTIVTDRKGNIQNSRRKVIQYNSYGDSLDYRGGHGTHVCATIAGASISTHTDMDGMAPDAKIAFYDVGDNDYIGYLSVPSLYNYVFPRAYSAGARVHSNSWKDGVDAYGSFSYEVDLFTTENDDFVALFAAGNQGGSGLRTIGAPANSKNGIAVGASEVRHVSTDEPVSELTVAWFSSIGPTFDGRLKPDIVAPGSFIMSAYAGLASSLQAAVEAKSSSASSVDQTCASISMIGTSMACPVAAGVALLIRQYFMDSSFWAKNCNPYHLSCKKGAFTPSGYLVKAVLLHSGTQMARYSTSDFNHKSTIPSIALEDTPDVFQGYGSIQLNNVLPLESGLGLAPELQLVLWDALIIEENTLFTWTISLTKAQSQFPLKITLCWYDPPSEIGVVSNLLLHDLDLLVIAPDGTEYWGNDAVGGDGGNTNEQIHISSLSCESDTCYYMVYVDAYVITESYYQKLAVVFTTAGTVSEPISKKSYSSPSSTILAADYTLGVSSSSNITPLLSTVSTEGETNSNIQNTVTSSSSSQYSTYTMNIPKTYLSVTKSNNEYISDVVKLSSFYYSGTLESITVKLLPEPSSSGSTTSSVVDGFYAFIFEIIITDPQGFSAQIGGYNSFSVANNFYQREWPRSWCKYHAAGSYFVASRDLSPSDLSGSGMWTAMIKLGYPKAISKVLYSGSITLSFDTLDLNAASSASKLQWMTSHSLTSSITTPSSSSTTSSLTSQSTVAISYIVKFYLQSQSSEEVTSSDMISNEIQTLLDSLSNNLVDSHIEMVAYLPITTITTTTASEGGTSTSSSRINTNYHSNFNRDVTLNIAVLVEGQGLNGLNGQPSSDQIQTIGENVRTTLSGASQEIATIIEIYSFQMSSVEKNIESSSFTTDTTSATFLNHISMITKLSSTFSLFGLGLIFLILASLFLVIFNRVQMSSEILTSSKDNQKSIKISSNGEESSSHSLI